ncbi:MAG: hypothetical protein ABLT11_07015 [Candidatus Acidiferrum sp.]
MNTLRLLIVACVALLPAPLAKALELHGFVWNSSTGMTDIGSLGGDCYALAINDSGVVAGYSYLAGNTTYHAFIWTASGGMVDLGTLPGGSESSAYAINSAGDLAGEGTDASGNKVPLYWSPEDGFVTLGNGSTAFYNFAVGINDQSYVTGEAQLGPVVKAFLWRPGLKKPRPIGPAEGAGFDINNLRHITGRSNNRAAVWELSGVHLIGDYFSVGYSINDHDEVAGAGANGGFDAFYWSPATRLVLLQTLAGYSTAAESINESGAIAGVSFTPGGFGHAVIWPDYTSAPRDLGTLSGGQNSYGQGINNLGQVVGFADAP